MAYGKFVWTDLSTYDVAAAKADYASLFGWAFAGDDTYDFALLHGVEVAAIFTMPDRLAQMNMPSFWMSYVHVENLDESVEDAQQHERVILEVAPQPFGSDARVALVRDPSGAGFTLYEGPQITSPTCQPGSIAARYHHLPNVAEIAPFYQHLFGWTFIKTEDHPWPVYDIKHPDGSTVAQVEEVPELIRGRFRYWMPCFAVASPDAVLATLKARGGVMVTEFSDARYMLQDRQGAHFMIG